MVRKPKLTEVVAIKALLDEAVTKGSVLPRELPELYENVRDFYVYVDESGLVGCVALHIDMVDLAAVVGEAQRLNIARVYALTRVPGFFLKSNFREVDKMELPYKVFKDCMRCRLFPGCDELAMVRDLPVVDETLVVCEEAV